MKAKALIAMSGGVDSAVAAKLTADAGYDCIGCTMQLYDNEDAGVAKERACCTAGDTDDARRVCALLGIPHYTLNMKDVFREKVMERFARAYELGMTPNPCVDCNRFIKFAALHQKAKELGCGYVVTGHYARRCAENGTFFLRKGRDENKDQSYVLYDMTQETLAHTLFPMGEDTKAETREIAEKYGFVNAKKPDSQDICFVPDGDYAAAVERITGRKSIPGEFTDLDGNVLGTHKGIIHYTIGQRRGLGLASTESWYVCGIDPQRNRVLLGRAGDVFAKEVLAEEVNWISGIAPDEPFYVKAKIRYRQKEQRALCIPTGETSVHLVFDEPQRAVTKGQSAVFYDGDTVLGGGVITGSR